MSKEIFISHAQKDQLLIDEFVDLLQTGININSDSIFCTSLEGLGILPGENIIDHIKTQIEAPQVVITILTPNYYHSEFCLCELGATWAMSHNIIPFIVPPLKYEDIRGVLTGIQVISIENQDRMNEFFTHITTIMGIKKPNFARWASKSSKFINKLDIIISSIDFSKQIFPKDHEKIVSRLEQATIYIDELESEIEKTKEINEKLKKCKNAEEVKKIESEYSENGENEIFTNLLEVIEDNLSEFDKEIARYIIYEKFELPYNPDFQYYKDEYDDAVRRKIIDLENKEVNWSNRKVNRLEESIIQLENFVYNEASENFDEYHENKYDIPPELDNSEFWEIHFKI